MLGKIRNKKYKKYLTQAGFTIMELIVSIFIIALISGILVVNYRGASQRSNLINVVQKAISDVKLAESYSLGSKEYDGAMPAGGWGIIFSLASPDSYIIFADENNNQQYDIGEADSAKGGKTIILPSGVSLDSINLGNRVDIIFLPPDPTIFINGAGDAARVRFKETTNNSTKTMEVNSLGLAEAVD